MKRATRIGMLVVLVGAAVAVTAWMLRAPAGVRYAGQAHGAAAIVSLRLDGIAPPEKVTIDLGGGVQIVAAKLP